MRRVRLLFNLNLIGNRMRRDRDRVVRVRPIICGRVDIKRIQIARARLRIDIV